MKSLLTREQQMNLTVSGTEAEEYWRNSLPKMYQKLAADGTLYPMLKRMGESWDQRIVDMMHQGMSEDGAKEIVREEMHSLPPEK